MAETSDKASAGIREAAADWVVRWNTAGVQTEEECAFCDWLRRSPLHVKEYLRAEAAWLAMDGPAKADRGDVQMLLRERPANLIEFNKGEPAAHPDSKEVITAHHFVPSRHFAVAAAFAGALLTLGIFSALWLGGRPGTYSYSTSIGESRRVVLDDGSALELNTHSKVRVKFDDIGRDIYLDEGEAYFEVAKDPRRPFRVISDTAVVRAVGTQFNVYRRRGKTVVTVIEGRVAVSASEIDRSVELAAGHVAESQTTAVIVQSRKADPQAATAWRQRRLIFRNQPLAEVIAEFNRYNRQQLIIEDGDLAAERISAVFDAGDPRALVRFLAQQSNVGARELSGSKLLLAPPQR